MKYILYKYLRHDMQYNFISLSIYIAKSPTNWVDDSNVHRSGYSYLYYKNCLYVSKFLWGCAGLVR